MLAVSGRFAKMHCAMQHLQDHGASATAAANISTPSACPWHQFWEGVTDPTSWQAALPSVRQYAAQHVLHTTAVAAVAVPVLGMLCQRQGRQMLFQVSAPAHSLCSCATGLYLDCSHGLITEGASTEAGRPLRSSR